MKSNGVGDILSNNRFTLENIEEFNYLHNVKGVSLREIAKIFNTNHNTIKKNLVKAGFSYRLRKYELDEHFFSELDSLEKIHVLGWIYSDGQVFFYEAKNHAGVKVKVQNQDSYILQYFANLLSSNAPILPDYTSGKEYSKITFGSKLLYNDLLKFGLEHNKTFKLEYPQEIIWDHRPFILGVFEGDGCISRNKSTGMPILNFTGTESIIKGIKNIFESELGVNIVKIHQVKNSFTLSYSGPQSVYKIAKWMYSWSPSVFLTRKRELINKYLQRDLYGKEMVVFRCPQCGEHGHFEKRNLYQLKKYFFGAKFCSLSCSGKFSRAFQLNDKKLTLEMKEAIKNNIVGFEKVYIKSKWGKV